MVIKYKTGTEVAFDMTDPYSDYACCEGYVLHIIKGDEDEDFLDRCCIFSKETMDRLR